MINNSEKLNSELIVRLASLRAVRPSLKFVAYVKEQVVSEKLTKRPMYIYSFSRFALIVFIAIVFSTSSVMVAAYRSQPGDLFFPLKKVIPSLPVSNQDPKHDQQEDQKNNEHHTDEQKVEITQAAVPTPTRVVDTRKQKESTDSGLPLIKSTPTPTPTLKHHRKKPAPAVEVLIPSPVKVSIDLDLPSPKPTSSVTPTRVVDISVDIVLPIKNIQPPLGL